MKTIFRSNLLFSLIFGWFLIFSGSFNPAGKFYYTGASGSLSGDSADTWAHMLEHRHGTLLAIYVPAEGFAWRDENGHVRGVTPDILREFAVFLSDAYEMELNINFVSETDWLRFYRRVIEAGDGVIGMGNVTITEARRAELQFSPPYLTNIATLITHRDAPELASISEISSAFAGRSALAFRGTLHQQRLQNLINEHFDEAGMEFATTNDEIIGRVSASDKYFAYIDIYNYHRAAMRGAALKRHPFADESAELFGYIMPLESTWGGVIEEFFARDGGFVNSDRYREILETWLGEDLAGILIGAAN